jgi:chromate transporter
MRHAKHFSNFPDAVNVASVAVIIAVCYEMGREAITDWKTIVIGLASIVLTFGLRKINTAFIVLGGSLVGYLLSFV